MVYNPQWNAGTFEMFEAEAEAYKDDLDRWDIFTTSFKETVATNPDRMFANKRHGDRSDLMSPAQANREFQLEGTPVAFDEPGEGIIAPQAKTVSREQAMRVKNRWIAQQLNESRIESVQEEFPVTGWMAGFGGNLTGGFYDLTTLTTSILTGGLSTVMGGVLGKQALTSIAKSTFLNKHIIGAQTAKFLGGKTAQSIAVQLADNFAASLMVDAAAMSINDRLYNRDMDIEQRAFHVLAGTAFGTLFGVGLDYKRIKADQIEFGLNMAKMQKVRSDANALTKQYGSRADKYITEAVEKGMMDVRNGVTPNVDYPAQMAEYIDYTTKPHQKPYKNVPIKSKEDVLNRTFYLSKFTDDTDFNHPSGHGNGAVEAMDNENFMENISSTLDNSRSGEVIEVRVKKGAKILTDTEFEEMKDTFRDALATLEGKQYDKVRKEWPFVVDAADNVQDLKAFLHEATEDFKDIPPIDDIVNKILVDNDIDLYTFSSRGTFVDPDLSTQNGVVFLSKDMFDKTKPTKHSILYGDAQEGIPSFPSKDGKHFLYNDSILEVVHSRKTPDFIADDPQNSKYLKPLQDLTADELKRRNDPKSKLTYDKEAEQKIQEVVKENVQKYDEDPQAAKALIESEGETFVEIEMKAIEESKDSNLTRAVKFYKEGIEEIKKTAAELAEICSDIFR